MGACIRFTILSGCSLYETFPPVYSPVPLMNALVRHLDRYVAWCAIGVPVWARGFYSPLFISSKICSFCVFQMPYLQGCMKLDNVAMILTEETSEFHSHQVSIEFKSQVFNCKEILAFA